MSLRAELKDRAFRINEVREPCWAGLREQGLPLMSSQQHTDRDVDNVVWALPMCYELRMGLDLVPRCCIKQARIKTLRLLRAQHMGHPEGFASHETCLAFMCGSLSVPPIPASSPTSCANFQVRLSARVVKTDKVEAESAALGIPVFPSALFAERLVQVL